MPKLATITILLCAFWLLAQANTVPQRIRTANSATQTPESEFIYLEGKDVILFRGKVYAVQKGTPASSMRLLEEEVTTEPVEEEHSGHGVHQRYPPGSFEFWACVGICLVIVCIAGLVAGQTAAYLSMDDLFLQMKLKSDNEKDREQAKLIKPLLDQRHLLLSTLLVANAIMLESLPIFLDRIVPSWLAILISTIAVVFFSEIIPQAYFTGPNKIEIAVALAPIIRFLLNTLGIICIPLGKLLDYLLGVHGGTRFVKKELKTLIELHHQGGGDGHHGQEMHAIGQKREGLTPEEIKMITSTIDLRDRQVKEAMVPIEKVFALHSNDLFTVEMLDRIRKRGFSKVPVFEGSSEVKIKGILKAKALINFPDADLNKPVDRMASKFTPPLIVPRDTSLLDTLMLFQTNKAGVALIAQQTMKEFLHEKTDKLNVGGNRFHSPAQNSPDRFFTKNDAVVNTDINEKRIIGLISLKDIFEEIMKTELKDDDEHIVTLYSQDIRKQMRSKKPGQEELCEAEEPTERNPLKQPLLGKGNK